MTAPSTGGVLGALADAHVQFVLTGDPDAQPLRVVVSRHPTNLAALGRVLEALGATFAGIGTEEAGGVRRVGEPDGTLRAAVGDVVLDVVVGGPYGSLYAETAASAVTRKVDGVEVQWATAPVTSETPSRPTGRLLGRRLLSLAEALSHLGERRIGEVRGGEVPPDEPGGGAPTAGE